MIWNHLAWPNTNGANGSYNMGKMSNYSHQLEQRICSQEKLTQQTQQENYEELGKTDCAIASGAAKNPTLQYSTAQIRPRMSKLGPN